MNSAIVDEDEDCCSFRNHFSWLNAEPSRLILIQTNVLIGKTSELKLFFLVFSFVSDVENEKTRRIRNSNIYNIDSN